MNVAKRDNLYTLSLFALKLEFEMAFWIEVQIKLK